MKELADDLRARRERARAMGGDQPLESRDERTIVGGHLAVKNERPGLEPAERLDQLRKSLGEVVTLPAHQAHPVRAFDRYQPPAVDLLLVDPSDAMEAARRRAWGASG